VTQPAIKIASIVTTIDFFTAVVLQILGGIRYPLGIMPTIFNPPYMITNTAIMIPILRKFSGVIIGVTIQTIPLALR
jgi:hypothetical protein